MTRQIQAGQLPGAALDAGNAVRIMTGAPIPDGVDAIVPYEFTDEVKRRRSGEHANWILNPDWRGRDSIYFVPSCNRISCSMH